MMSQLADVSIQSVAGLRTVNSSSLLGRVRLLYSPGGDIELSNSY